MEPTKEDIRASIVPKSDQLNADDLLTGPITVKVLSVSRGDKEQPIVIGIDGGYKPYKPCKSMRRVLIKAWGDSAAAWVGRRMTLFCDPEVKWAGVKVGGIRISHLSDIGGDQVYALTMTRGQRAEYSVKALAADVARDLAETIGRAIESQDDEAIRTILSSEILQRNKAAVWKLLSEEQKKTIKLVMQPASE